MNLLTLTGEQAEAITESLKNILLVMFASEIFKPSDPSLLGLTLTASNLSSHSTQSPLDLNTQHELWELSWRTIDSFCPQLRQDFLLKICTKHIPHRVELPFLTELLLSSLLFSSKNK
jgi:hypothetical protein